MFSPSYQSSSPTHHITRLNNQGLYFDKISDLQHIRDEWKLVIYYNMTTYWQGLNNINHYVTHLNQLCYKYGADSQYKNIVLQLEHELGEIQHYNKLLKNQNRRHKRGLVNGLGYVANALFGVLDEHFAEQYRKDIGKIEQNENHLQALIKNQTLIVESESNILRRNEETMNKQFKLINSEMETLLRQYNKINSEHQMGLYIISSSFTANIIISNLRRIQQTILDAIVDITHGHIDTHLISPDQLEEQTNIILGQLHRDLTLPVDINNLRDLYKLLRVHAAVNQDYFIIEIKIPLASNEFYELDSILAVPQRRGLFMYEISPKLPYIAFNLRKDMVLFLSEQDLQSCIHATKDRLLCSLDKPVYDLRAEQSICDIKLMPEGKLCETKATNCSGDKWIKLHNNNIWLFSCCEKCRVRIFCESDMSMEELEGNGLISLGQGCTLKADTFTIYAHNNYFKGINQEFKNIEMPPQSALNSIINISLPLDAYTFKEANNTHSWNELREQISDIKKQESSQKLNIHDVHHYTGIYILATAFLVLSAILVISWLRKRRLPKEDVEEMELERVPQRPLPLPRTISVSEISASAGKVNQGTSSIVLPPIRFKVPSAVQNVQSDTTE